MKQDDKMKPEDEMAQRRAALLEKQQKRKEKTCPKVPSESSREKGPQCSKQDPNASSSAVGNESSEKAL